jgi:hypothetical protein
VAASTPVAPVCALEPAASSPVPASAPEPASTPVVKIVVFGDDEVAGFALSPYGVPTLVSPTQQANLQSALQAKFNDTGITVANAATGGTSSSLQNEMGGMDGGGSAEPQRMVESGASIVIQEHMLNDALGGETVDQYAGYLTQWIEDARAAGLAPVLEESGPVCDGNHPQLASYVNAMSNVGKRLNVPVIHQYLYIQGIAGWQSHMTGCLYPDATLLAAKARQELAVIAPLVKAALGE